MLTFILMLIVALPTAYFTYTAGQGGHWIWTIFAVLAAAIAVAVPVNLWIRRRLLAVSAKLQARLQEEQEKLRRKILTMQNKGMVGPRTQAGLEHDMAQGIRNAMAILDEAAPLSKWSVMVPKQVNMMRGQLFFQIRDYDAARPLLEKALALDPVIVCMQMVLAWRAKPEDGKSLDKIFARGAARFKYDRAVLIYAVYSWLLVKQQRLTEAVEILDKGKEKTSDPVIAQNWKHLVNNEMKRFSYAGLGDQWFALGLETPPQVRQRQMQTPFGGRVSRGGFR